MTTWCRVCQKRPSVKVEGPCAGMCDPCRQMVQLDVREGREVVRRRLEATALALARLLEAHRQLNP